MISSGIEIEEESTQTQICVLLRSRSKIRTVKRQFMKYVYDVQINNLEASS